MKAIIYSVLGLISLVIFWFYFDSKLVENNVVVQQTTNTSEQFTQRHDLESHYLLQDTIVGEKRDEEVNDSSILQENLPRLSFQTSYNGKLYKNNRTVKERQISVIENGDAYQLMEFSRGIGALLAMYEASDSIHYLSEALDLSTRIIGRTKQGKDIANNPKIFKDEYRGWVNHNPQYKESRRGGPHLQEVPLFESYLFRYLAKLAYIVHTSNNPAIDNSLKSKSERILTFVRINGWQKWYERGEKKSQGCYPYLFRSRTHMTSHWAIVALYLRELINDEPEKRQYSTLLSLYDQQLKSNLQVTKDQAYVWNMTWEKSWPYGTNCNSPDAPIIQDVSHGNQVVTYIVEAFDLSKGLWDKQDIARLINTVKYVLYDSNRMRFNGNLNGGFDVKTSDGIQMADGFLKLARYDKQLFLLFENVRHKQAAISAFSHYEPQYVAELMLAEKRLNK